MPTGVAVDAAGNRPDRGHREPAGSPRHRRRLDTSRPSRGNGVPGHAGDGFRRRHRVARISARRRRRCDGERVHRRFAEQPPAAGSRPTARSRQSADNRTRLCRRRSPRRQRRSTSRVQSRSITRATCSSPIRAIRACVAWMRTSGQVTTIAGNGMPGNLGDQGVATAARLNCPAASSSRRRVTCSSRIRARTWSASGRGRRWADHRSRRTRSSPPTPATASRGSSATARADRRRKHHSTRRCRWRWTAREICSSARTTSPTSAEVDAATGILTSPVSDGGSRAMGIDSADHWVVADNFNGGLSLQRPGPRHE